MLCGASQIVLLGLILSFVVGVESLQWTGPPSNVSIPLGGEARMNCSFEGESVQAIWTDPAAVPLFYNNASFFNDSNQYSIVGRFDLRIQNVGKSNRGYYTCSIKGLGTEKGFLDVLLSPNNTSIQTNDSRTQKVEGDVISLSCSSIGNPAPTIKWYRGDNLLVNGANVQIGPTHTESVNGGSETKSTSQLILKLQYTDHDLDITCHASNQVNQNNPVKIPYRIRVLYAPRVTLTPSPYSILLSSSGTLTCNVNANPAASSVQWYKDGSLLPDSSSTLLFTNVQRSESGNYTCRASNTINGQALTSQASSLVSVIYEPVITVPSTLYVNESSTLSLTCQVDANPPPLNVKWKKIDGSSESSGAVLEVQDVPRSLAGNYTCMVEYRLEPTNQPARQDNKKEYTYVHVQYRPGNAQITAVNNPVLLGQSLTLRCSLQEPGFPAPSFTWKRVESGVTFSETTNTLVIPQTTLQSIGNYSCTPHNVLGSGQPGAIDVDVHERPTFLESPPTSQTVGSNTTSLVILCKVRGRPAPIIRWYKNNQPITSGDIYTIQSSTSVVDKYSFQVSSTLVFQGRGRGLGLTFDDIANYTCEETDLGLQQTMQLFILFTPTVGSHNKVAVSANQSTTLVCSANGYPIPSFAWYRHGSVVANSSKYGIRETQVTGVATATSSMVVRDIHPTDFGNYSCVVTNSQGSTTKVITITVKNKPESPTNVRMISYTWDSVAMAWDPGFDGGERQTFHIHYTNQVDPGSAKNVKVIPETATQYNITGLVPSTSYKFEVFGVNVLGSGNYSESLIVQTKDLSFPTPTSTPELVVADSILTVPFVLNDTYCIQVKYSKDSGTTWTSVVHQGEECFRVESVVPVSGEGINKLNVSICLSVRTDVCGRPVIAAIRAQETNDLTETEVIIIGVVCLVILGVLIGILVYIVCRRRRNAKEYENRIAQQNRQPVPTTQVNGNGVPPPKPKRGYENQDDPPPSYNGAVANGHITLDTSYDSQLEKYENEINMRNMHNLSYGGGGSPNTPRKDPSQFVDLPEDKKDSLKSGQESGYSTPEGQAQKPKKAAPFKAKRRIADPPYLDQLYYADFVPFAHDPPGHTCGLPCCNSDLYIHLKLGHHGGCMPMPFHQEIDNNNADGNFTLRRNQVGFIQGKPTFVNGKYHSLQPSHSQGNRRHPATTFRGDRPINTLSGTQRHFLNGRGITLPRNNESSSDRARISFQRRREFPSESSSESEIEFCTKIYQSTSDIDHSSNCPKPYPWKLLHARKRFGVEGEGQYEYGNNMHNYETLAMDNPTFDSNLSDNVDECLDDDVFLQGKEPSYCKLNLDRFHLDSKCSTLERISVMSNVKPVCDDQNHSIKSRESDEHTYARLNLRESLSSSVRSASDTISRQSDSVRSRDNSLPLPLDDLGTAPSMQMKIPSTNLQKITPTTSPKLQAAFLPSPPISPKKVQPATRQKIPPATLPKPERPMPPEASTKSFSLISNLTQIPIFPAPMADTTLWDSTISHSGNGDYQNDRPRKPLKSALKTSSLQANLKLSDFKDKFIDDPYTISSEGNDNRSRSKKFHTLDGPNRDANQSSAVRMVTCFDNHAYQHIESTAPQAPQSESGPITLIL